MKLHGDLVLGLWARAHHSPFEADPADAPAGTWEGNVHPQSRPNAEWLAQAKASAADSDVVQFAGLEFTAFSPPQDHNCHRALDVESL
jgi:hypothetical protein